MAGRALWLGMAAWLVCVAARADEKSPVREANLAVVRQTNEANLKAYQGNPDFLVLPGLLADRTEKRIRLWAEATQIRAGETIEFFLITENSGHDYEALAVSFAKPSDVHRALLFLGLQPGRPADYSKLQFWPKGERVLMGFSPMPPGPPAPAAPATNAVASAVWVENLVRNNRTQAPLPRQGFVFTGSSWAGCGSQPGTNAYRADLYGPGSIASDYNERDSVLDVPREMPQSDEYGQQVVSTNFAAFMPNSMIEVRLEPEYKDGRQRVMDVDFSVSAKPATNLAAQELAVDLKDAKGHWLFQKQGLAAAAEKIEALVEQGHTPFMTVRFEDALTLRNVRDVCAVIALQIESGVCVEPPPAGALTYRAFVPPEKFRDRAGRAAQPWELRLALKNSKVMATLTEIKQVWVEDQAPELKVTDYPIANPAALRKALDDHGPGLPVILVFAAPALTYGQLMEFVRPVMSTHPTLHVFVERAGE